MQFFPQRRLSRWHVNLSKRCVSCMCQRAPSSSSSSPVPGSLSRVHTNCDSGVKAFKGVFVFIQGFHRIFIYETRTRSMECFCSSGRLLLFHACGDCFGCVKLNSGGWRKSLSCTLRSKSICFTQRSATRVCVFIFKYLNLKRVFVVEVVTAAFPREGSLFAEWVFSRTNRLPVKWTAALHIYW